MGLVEFPDLVAQGVLDGVPALFTEAAIDIFGADRVRDVTARFIPHVTVAYSNASGDMAPLQARLAAITPRSTSTVVRAVDLLEVSRDTHVY
jgi:hypothetical protein